jgi:UDP-glucose 4-epimerase
MTNYRDFYSDRRVLVTGGLGFLGSSLVRELVALRARVTVVDSLIPMFGGNLFNIADVADAVTVNICDIRDADAMNHLVRGQDILFHIGMQTSHVDSMSDPLWDVDINCRGNLLVYEAVRRNNPSCFVVYAGTRGQYGIVDRVPVDESQPMRPTDIYGVNKGAAEHYGFIYRKAHGLRFTSLRINNSYGPRHQMKHGKYGILNWFVRTAMDDGTIRLFGDGSQKRDYNYVDDVTDAFLRAGALQLECDGQAFNLGSGKPRSLREATELVIQHAGSGRFELAPWPNERKAIETGDYVADFSKFTATTGWVPRVEMEQGLAQTVAFYKEHKPHYW